VVDHRKYYLDVLNSDIRMEGVFMPTNTPAPTEGGGKPNRTRRAWSDEDKRNLTISFVGGLAANIGLVFVVGVALAIDRAINHYPSHTRNTIYDGFASLGIAMFIILLGGFAIRRATGTSGPLSEPYNRIVWGYVAILGASLLVLLGFAAGLSK
jgi:hypothetical protein